MNQHPYSNWCDAHKPLPVVVGIKLTRRYHHHRKHIGICGDEEEKMREHPVMNGNFKFRSFFFLWIRLCQIDAGLRWCTFRINGTSMAPTIYIYLQRIKWFLFLRGILNFSLFWTNGDEGLTDFTFQIRYSNSSTRTFFSLCSHGKQFVNAKHGMPLWLDGPLSQRFWDKINKYINIANLAN